MASRLIRNPIVVGFIGLIIGAIIGASGGASQQVADDVPAPVPTVTVTETEIEVAEPEVSDVYVPRPSDFKIALKILEKQCFGSAGCNVTFRIDVSYSGEALDADREFTVVYVVRGGEDGPVRNNFTLIGAEIQYEAEELISTNSSSARLRAEVVDVLEG